MKLHTFTDTYLVTGLYATILWHVDPLLGNEPEISKYTTAVCKQARFTATIGYNNKINGAFYPVRVEML
jgi:hypothetical protein